MTKKSELTVSTLGAFADELSFAMDRAVAGATGLRGEASAALTALLNSPRLSVKQLARFLGIASPSAVQLVSRLESDGLLARRPGPDDRSRALLNLLDHPASIGQDRDLNFISNRGDIALCAALF